MRAFVQAASARLDPASRYVPELLAVVDAARDVADLERRLDAGGRGQHWAGATTFGAMSLAQKLEVNLVTNESSFMRFETGELGFLRRNVLPFLEGRPAPGARVLSLPCALGEEAVSLAIECVEAGIESFTVRGYDIQPACIATARTGRIPISGLPRYVVGLVDPVVHDHLEFAVADVFADPIGGPYDLVVCRNFLGYFVPASIHAVLAALLGALASPGYLLLDAFVLGKHPEVFDRLLVERPDLARLEGPFFRRGAQA